MNHSKSREYLRQVADNFSNDMTGPLVEKPSRKFTDFSIARILELPTSSTSNVTKHRGAEVESEARNLSPKISSSDFVSSWELMSDFDDSAVEFWNLPQQMMPARFDEAELVVEANFTAASSSSETFTSNFKLNDYLIPSAPSMNFTGMSSGVPPEHPEDHEDSGSSFGNATTEESSSSLDATSGPWHLSDRFSDFLSSDMHGPVNFAVISPDKSQCYGNNTEDPEDSFVSLDEANADVCQDLPSINSQNDETKSHKQPCSEMESSDELIKSTVANETGDQSLLDELEDTPTSLLAPSHGSYEVAHHSNTVCSSTDSQSTERSNEPSVLFVKEITKEMAEEALKDLNIIRRQIKVAKKKRVRFARGTKFTPSKSKRTLKQKPPKTASKNRRATLLPGTRIELEHCSIEAEWN